MSDRLCRCGHTWTLHHPTGGTDLAGCEANPCDCEDYVMSDPASGRWPVRTVEERFWEKVNKTGDCWLWTAGKSNTGYGTFWLDGKDQKAHRIAYELTNGPIPTGLQVDHLCHRRDCVNPAHLRAVTQKQNIENHQGRPKRHSKSGVRGVYRKCGRWCAAVRHDGRHVHIGYFDSLAEAESAVLDARRNLHSHNDVDRVKGGVS